MTYRLGDQIVSFPLTRAWAIPAEWALHYVAERSLGLSLWARRLALHCALHLGYDCHDQVQDLRDLIANLKE